MSTKSNGSVYVVFEECDPHNVKSVYRNKKKLLNDLNAEKDKVEEHLRTNPCVKLVESEGSFLKYHYDIEWHAIDIAKKEYNLELITYSDEELARFRAAQAPIKAEYIKMLDKKGLDGKGIMDTWKELFTKYEK